MINLQAVLERDTDFIRAAMRSVVQAALEAEMTEALGAEKGERTEGRLGYRNGYYSRSLVTRAGRKALFCRVTPPRVDRLGALPNHQLPILHQHRRGLPAHCLHRHRTRRRARRRLADRFCIVAIVLVPLDKRLDVLWRDQFHPVTEPGQHSFPMTRASTRFRQTAGTERSADARTADRSAGRAGPGAQRGGPLALCRFGQRAAEGGWAAADYATSGSS